MRNNSQIVKSITFVTLAILLLFPTLQAFENNQQLPDNGDITWIDIYGGYRAYYIYIENFRNETVNGTYSVSIFTLLPRRSIHIDDSFTVAANSSIVIPVPFEWRLFGLTSAGASVSSNTLGYNHCYVGGHIRNGYVIITTHCFYSIET